MDEEIRVDARNDVATSISVDKSQNAYVSGISNGVTIAGLTYKYDINGNEVWAASYVNQQDIPIVRVVDEDDEADESNIVVSTSNNEFYQTTGYDYLTIKYNGMSGDTLWKRRFNHINSFDNVLAMTVDSDGNVYVTGKVMTTYQVLIWPQSNTTESREVLCGIRDIMQGAMIFQTILL